MATENMYRLLRPLLFALDPERVHDAVLRLGNFLSRTDGKPSHLLGSFFSFRDSRLETDFCGIRFPNPVGLAAGFDKNGELTGLLPHLGFGYEEVGSVTAGAGGGNPKPRLFRLPRDRAIINRMGLPGRGVDEIVSRLQAEQFSFPVGVNVAKTHDPEILGDRAIEDILHSFRKVYESFHYTALNISCPNTREGKTFEDPVALTQLLRAVAESRAGFARPSPLLIKISPDVTWSQLDEILRVSEENDIDGYVIGNTSVGREGLRTPSQAVEAVGNGGLSGRPLRQRATQMIRHVYQHLDRANIIGVGGIDSAESAYEKIRAGASLIQVYTGLVYEGPGLAKNINRGLLERLEKDGFASIAEAVGTEAG